MPQTYIGNAIYEEIIRLGLEPGQFVYLACRARLDAIKDGKIKVARQGEQRRD